MSRQLKSYQILNSWWRRKQARPDSISLRAMAKKLKISPGYLSRIISGKLKTPLKLITPINKILKMDSATEKQWIDALSREALQKNVGKSKNFKRTSAFEKSPLDAFELGPSEAEWLLEKWHRTAILDLTTVVNFDSNPISIAKRLGISLEEAQKSITYLIDAGLLVHSEDGNLKKKYLHIRFPSATSKKSFRQHHISQMKRAIKHVEEATTPHDFKNRLVFGITFACNKARFDEIKLKVHRAIYEATQELSAGNCDEVYQINLQLFPQTKN